MRDTSAKSGSSLRLRYARLLALASLVIAFAAFYPYLNVTGSCGDPGCPHFSQGHASPSLELSAGALVTGATLAAPALAGCLRRHFTSAWKPEEIYLSPEPEPPRL